MRQDARRAPITFLYPTDNKLRSSICRARRTRRANRVGSRAWRGIVVRDARRSDRSERRASRRRKKHVSEKKRPPRRAARDAFARSRGRAPDRKKSSRSRFVLGRAIARRTESSTASSLHKAFMDSTISVAKGWQGRGGQSRARRGAFPGAGVGNAKRVLRVYRPCGRKNNKIHAVSRRATRRCGRAFAPGRPAIRPGSAPITPRRAGIYDPGLAGVVRSRRVLGADSRPAGTHPRSCAAGGSQSRK